jgi:hypothetical protein
MAAVTQATIEDLYYCDARAAGHGAAPDAGYVRCSAPRKAPVLLYPVSSLLGS